MMDNTHRPTLQIDFQNRYQRQDENELNNCKLTGVVSALCLSSFYFGYSLVYLPAESVKDLSIVFGKQILETGSKAILLTTVCLGALIGSFMTPFLMPLLSRRTIIILFNVIALIIGGIIQIPNIWVLIMCRVFQGICCAQFSAVVPLYIRELVPKTLMPKFSVFPSLFVMVGIVSSYLLALILNLTDADALYKWRIQFTPIPQLIILIQTLLFVFGVIPESPCSLIRDQKIEQAKQVIEQFVGKEFSNDFLKRRIEQVQGETNFFCKNQKSIVQNGSKVYNWKAKLLSIQLPVMGQMTGICGLATQAGFIVLAFNSTLAKYTPVTFNTVQMLANVIPVFLYAKIGRKNITLFGNLGVGLCNIAIATLLFFCTQSTTTGNIAWGVIVVYLIIFGMCGPMIGIYAGQFTPPSYAFPSTVISWLFANIVIVSLSLLTDAYIFPYPAFYIYGGWTLISFIINVFLLKQTKNLTNEQIMSFYGKQA